MFRIAVAAVAGAAACAAHPYRRSQCSTPDDGSEEIMGKRGDYDASLLGPAARCSGGLIATNVEPFSGSEPHRPGKCSNVHRTKGSARAGSFSLVPVDPNQVIGVLCANIGSRYRYAIGVYDPDADDGGGEIQPIQTQLVNVAVVGGGVGGSAAFAASAAALDRLGPFEGSGPRVVMYRASPSSTTDRSSGVAWFPLNRSVDELKQAHGTENMTQANIEAYIASGNEAYQYWKTTAGLPLDPVAQPYYDYTNYTTGERSGSSFTISGCTTRCGTELGGSLRTIGTNLGGEVHESDAVLVNITEAPGGLYRLEFKSNMVVLARSVVLAVGGDGRRKTPAAFEGAILASSDNTGVHIDVANSLGLKLVGQDLKWGLEFQRINQTYVSERWFATRCIPGSGAAGYDRCRDYNQRTAAYLNQTSGWVQSIDSNVSMCATESGKSWDAAMTYYGATENSCGNRELRPGMIDGKGGFELDEESYCSPDHRMVCAAGTTSGHMVGGTYFAPGATLGHGLISGRISGNSSASRAAAFLTPRQMDEEPPAKKLRAPLLFVSGVWTALVGVAAHVAAALITPPSGLKTALGVSHYLLMTAAAALIWCGASIARVPGEGQDMRQTSTVHYRLGWTTVGLLALQVGGGLLLKVSALWGNRRLARIWSGQLHRFLGTATLVCMAVLYFTAVERPTPLTLYNWRMAAAKASAYAWSISIGLLLICGWTVYIKHLKDAPPNNGRSSSTLKLLL